MENSISFQQKFLPDSTTEMKRHSLNAVFVRHGETTGNIQAIIQGQSDFLLSEKGKIQAQILSERMKGEIFTRVYSSDLTRASETGEILRKSCKCDKPTILDKNLRERGYGVMENCHVSVIFKEAEMLKIDPKDVTPEGGETASEFTLRVSSFINDLREIASKSVEIEDILVVTHGAWLKSLIQFLVNESGFKLVNFDNTKLEAIGGNTSVTRLQFNPPDFNTVVFNSIYDMSHLPIENQTEEKYENKAKNN